MKQKINNALEILQKGGIIEFSCLIAAFFALSLWLFLSISRSSLNFKKGTIKCRKLIYMEYFPPFPLPSSMVI